MDLPPTGPGLYLRELVSLCGRNVGKWAPDGGELVLHRLPYGLHSILHSPPFATKQLYAF